MIYKTKKDRVVTLDLEQKDLIQNPKVIVSEGSKLNLLLNLHKFNDCNLVIVQKPNSILNLYLEFYPENNPEINQIKKSFIANLTMVQEENSQSKVNILLNLNQSKLELGFNTFLIGKNSVTEIHSNQILSNSSHLSSIYKICAYNKKELKKGRLFVKSLHMDDTSFVKTVPILDDSNSGAELFHSFKTIKHSPEEQHYLKTRGLSQNKISRIYLNTFVSERKTEYLEKILV